MMEISYFTSCGKGTVTLNLYELLPCTQKKFRIILDMCEKSEKCHDHVSFLYDFIAGKVDGLKSDRSKLNENSGFDKPVISKINTEMKKWLALSGIISKEYGFEEITDTDATIKMKKSTFYAIKDNSVIEVEGWTFEKGGYTFETYKDKRGYRVLLNGTGLGVSSTTVKTKKDVITFIDSRLLETLKKSDHVIKGARKLFSEKMIAAGYWTPEQAEEHTQAPSVAPEVPEVTQTPEIVEVATVPASVPDVETAHANKDTVASWTVRRMIIYRAFGKPETDTADIVDCATVKPYKPHIQTDKRTMVHLSDQFKKSENSGRYTALCGLPNPPPFPLCGVRSP